VDEVNEAHSTRAAVAAEAESVMGSATPSAAMAGSVDN
jgi:hypothetical protein